MENEEHIVRKVLIGNITEYGLPIDEAPADYVSVKINSHFDKTKFQTVFMFIFKI